jgi:homoserine dehydrogenase
MASDVDVTSETMGGTDEARQLVLASLKQKKPVVTANKNLLATHGDELFALATSQNLPIGFEASVAGGIPILRVIHESTVGDRLRAVHGILNGTSNYILTQMESRGIDFEMALKEAQKAGYAEADPTFDIDGLDARDKLCILARMAFGGRLKVSMSHLRHPAGSSDRCPFGKSLRLHNPPCWFGRDHRAASRCRCDHGWSIAARC